MATKNVALRNALVDLQTDLYDSGELVIYANGDVPVLTFQLAATSFGAASSGTAAGASLPITAIAKNPNDRVVTYATLRSQDGSKQITLLLVSATGGSGNVTLSDTNPADGASVDLTAMNWTESATVGGGA